MKRLSLLALLAFAACAHVGSPLPEPPSREGGGFGFMRLPSTVAREALGIRSSPMGQFESATGAPVYLGTIVVDNTAGGLTNATTATAFNATGAKLCNKVLLIQNVGTVDARILPVPASGSVVTLTRGAGALFGPTIGAGERVVVYMPGNEDSATTGCFLGAISTTAAIENVDVWELK